MFFCLLISVFCSLVDFLLITFDQITNIALCDARESRDRSLVFQDIQLGECFVSGIVS